MRLPCRSPPSPRRFAALATSNGRALQRPRASATSCSLPLARLLDTKRRPEPLICAAPRTGLLALALALGTPAFAEQRSLDLGDGKSLRFEVLDASSAPPSARGSALRVLRH